MKIVNAITKKNEINEVIQEALEQNFDSVFIDGQKNEDN